MVERNSLGQKEREREIKVCQDVPAIFTRENSGIFYIAKRFPELYRESRDSRGRFNMSLSDSFNSS